jgi:hypothetical protein
MVRLVYLLDVSLSLGGAERRGEKSLVSPTERQKMRRLGGREIIGEVN